MISKLERKDYWINKVIPNLVDDQVDIFLLFLTGETDYPLIINNKICFFSREPFLKMLSSIDIPISSKDLDNEIDYVIDMNKVLKLIKYSSLDKEGILIVSINTLLDLFCPLKIKFPDQYKSVLYLFADHLSFNKRYGSFLKEHEISREDLVDAISWLSGIILLNSSFNEKQLPNSTLTNI